MDTVTALKVARPYLAGLAAAGLLAGITAKVAGRDAAAAAVWAAVTLPVLLALLVEIVTSLRRGEVGLDIVAGLSMAAALIFGENLAAAIVALMYAGGQYLEIYAERTARREMTALLSRVPRTAIRHRDGQLEEVAVDVVSPGDRLLIRQGDVVPVDGTVAEGVGVLDQSALTGELLPVKAKPGEPVLSGSTNAGEAFDMIATRPAAESTYAGIVRLVEDAQRSRAPMSRLADRYAIVFLVLTVVLAGAAWWLSGDPIRAVAVLVVATPCPLILAVPVAIISGLSRAAKFGILIKGGKAIENLARVRTVVIDKTGTLTIGQARLIAIHVDAGITANEVLRIAASLDQASKHVIAQTIVDEARNKGLQLAVPTDVVETPGEGVVGRVDGRSVAVGGLRFVAGRVARSDASPLPHDRPPGALAVAVGIDGRLSGVLILADEAARGHRGDAQRTARPGHRAYCACDRRPARGGPFRCDRTVPRSRALRTDARSEDSGGFGRAQERPGDDDRRRGE